MNYDRLKQELERREMYRLQAVALIGYDPREQDLEPRRFPISERDKRSHRYLIIQLLRQRDGTSCYLCKKELDVDQSCIEHIIPISQGGENEPHNIAIACATCNTDKAGRYVSFNVTSAQPVYHWPK